MEKGTVKKEKSRDKDLEKGDKVKKKKDPTKDESDKKKDKKKDPSKDKENKEEKRDNKDKKHKDKSEVDKKRKDEPSRPVPRQPPQLSKKDVGKKKLENDYLAGVELPPSESSEDEYDRELNSDDDKDKPLNVVVTGREQKKLVDKERKAMERAFQAKQDALKEDENVFDVAYEGQGEDAVVSATDVKVHNLTVRAKGKILLENASLTIAAGRRYGLVGPNGRGKSTLLKLLARRNIPVPENIDVLLVEQEVVGSEQSALEAVVAADVELMELREEEKQLVEKLNKPEEQGPEFNADDATARLNEVYDRMGELGSSTAEARASKILYGLGFTPIKQRNPTSSFSGGWRMRISLARALYIQPTLLLLDEPTNHLDLRAVLWLEEYLQRWKKTLIVVSHDRDFLNTVTTDIIHLHDLKLIGYKGNFAQFEEMYEQKRREVNKAFEKYEKQLKAAKQSGKNAKANQEKVKNFASKQQASKAKARGMEDESGPSDQPKKWSDYTVTFHFPEPPELKPPLLQLVDADFKYPGREDFGMSGLNLGIDMGSRVAIVGPNGAGKSTLMNLLNGELTPVAGEMRKSQSLHIGRYNQHFVDQLSYDVNPVEYLMSRFPKAGLKPEGMRAMLGRFGLSGAHHLTPICKLSGGQKARVVFAAIALEEPHILLLDEPTNNLDMQSIDALCDAIEAFPGGVVVISHDAQLLAKLCEDEEKAEVWVVEDGELRIYPGDFDDYRDELIREITAELDDE